MLKVMNQFCPSYRASRFGGWRGWADGRMNFPQLLGCSVFCSIIS
jgi:hypothetical protein